METNYNQEKKYEEFNSMSGCGIDDTSARFRDLAHKFPPLEDFDLKEKDIVKSDSNVENN